MAYKYLNDNGLKAYTKKVKGALKDLHTPIAISSANTTESKAQNVRNIADFIAKAKAAGIQDVNGMAVSCIIDNDYSGVGYFYHIGDNIFIQGVLIKDDLIDNKCFSVDSSGQYSVKGLIVSVDEYNYVISDMLAQGARKPIILTPETTEVDEETFQKLLSDDVDVMFKDSDGEYCVLTHKYEEDTICAFCFTVLSAEGTTLADTYLYGYKVYINETAPHKATIEPLFDVDIYTLIYNSGFIHEYTLSPVLQEIDLIGTDAERKAKLTKFETDWKALTGASDLRGARFVGNVSVTTGSGDVTLALLNRDADGAYSGLSMTDTIDSTIKKIVIDPSTGSITITPLFSHLEPVEIFTENSAESKKKNLDSLNAYKANLQQLGVDTSISFQVPIYRKSNSGVEESGFLIYSNLPHVYKPYSGLFLTVDKTSFSIFGISSTGEFIEQTYYATLEDVQQANTEMLDAIKYSYTPVPLTATTSTNKTQLDLFLSKVPNAQVMHCTYKGVYAGTLHKINGSWYGVLVGESNTLAGQLSIKLQADGTIVEGTV